MVRKMYLTPPETPEGLTCRTLKMPNSKEWLGVFNLALYTLTEDWRWEQVNDTDLTIEQAVAKCQEVLGQFYLTSACDVCFLPTGEPIVRLNEDGEFEQLTGEGWEEPSGEYEIPPVEPRETGTDDEKKCLASANATNVMKTLYETLADDYAEGLTLLEAIAHFIAVVAALILLPGGLIAAAIALALVLFRIMFETAEFVTADYWTTEFDEKFQCALYECSSVDGAGVVTFDYVCFQNNLSARIDAFGDPLEVVLWGQVQAMLMFLGVDGLNLAGATTAIATADCSACADVWCYLAEFDNTLDVFEFVPGANCAGGGSGGTIQPAYLQSAACFQSPVTYNWLIIKTTFAARTVTFTEFLFDYGRGSFANYPPNGVQNVHMNFYLSGALVHQVTYGAGADTAGVYMQFVGSVVCDEIRLRGLMCDRVTGSSNGWLRVYHAMIAGEGSNPIGEDNCVAPE